MENKVKNSEKMVKMALRMMVLGPVILIVLILITKVILQAIGKISIFLQVSIIYLIITMTWTVIWFILSNKWDDKEED